MVNYVRKNDDIGDPRARINSMAHLQHASKNINDWRFERRPAPWGAPKSLVYVFVGIDKTTGIESPWNMDKADADEHGNFEEEEKRTISEFATWLQHLADAIRIARLKRLQEEQRLILPRQAPAALAARALLLKGNHPQ